MRVPEREAEILATADVVVAGGGPAGLGAAIAAARLGARVVLCERYGFLGGNLTVAKVGTICGLYVADGDGGFDPVVGGLARELADGLAAMGAGTGPVPFKETAVFLYVPWAAKRLADSLVAAEPGIDLLLHSLVSDVVVDDGRIRALVLATKQGPKAIEGRVFVDCTGDADVATFAGVQTELGPPGQRQFGSMQFVMQHVDAAAALGAMARFPEIIAEHGAHLSRDGGALIPTFRPGEFVGAMTCVRNRDGTPVDVTDVRDATLGRARGPPARGGGSRVPAGARPRIRGRVPRRHRRSALGVRETCRVVGDYVLTGADVEAGAGFDDAIARGAWPRVPRARAHDRVRLPPARRQLPGALPESAAARACRTCWSRAGASPPTTTPWPRCGSWGRASPWARPPAPRRRWRRGDGRAVAEVDVRELQNGLVAGGALL